MYKVNIPSKKIGDWEVSKFQISESSANLFNLRESISGRGREIYVGEYTQLKCKGEIIMSDTPAEIDDHLYFIDNARGHVLITGLGLGMVANAVAAKDCVDTVTVVEVSDDVINLVGNHLNHEKIRVIHSDAYDWKPDCSFDCAWHDIWPDICSDNLPEMVKIMEHYSDSVDPIMQSAWVLDECVSASQGTGENYPEQRFFEKLYEFDICNFKEYHENIEDEITCPEDLGIEEDDYEY